MTTPRRRTQDIKLVNPGQANAGDVNGICPHCGLGVSFRVVGGGQFPDVHNNPYFLGHRKCPNPECQKHVFVVIENQTLHEIYPPVPLHRGRPELHSSIVSPYRDDYQEADLVLSISPKASAALSRRLLQYLIREEAGIKKVDLFQEIEQLIQTGGLPSRVNGAIDAVRVIGNFAAHPIKSTHTGEIVEVEPGEAEWNLDVLDMLFDFYFVQREVLKARKDALNVKLLAAGKQPLK